MTIKFQLQAFSELIQRYGKSFGDAWRHRSEFEPVKRLPYESEFLPAALSLQETPLSPAPRLAIWFVLSFAFLALLWSIWGQIDLIATAQGKVIPNDRIKTIQPLETGRVTRVLVSEGQKVKAGQVLIELDATITQAEKTRIGGDLAAAIMIVARGQAFMRFLDSGVQSTLQRPEMVTDIQFAEAQSLLRGQIAEYSAKLVRVDTEMVRREAEFRSTTELVRKLLLTVPIAQERAKDLKNLVDLSFVSKHGFLEREQVRIEQEADLSNQKSKLQEIEATLGEVRAQRQVLLAEARRIAQDSILDGQQKKASLSQEYLKADSRDRLMVLTAPVDGTVQQVVTHTVGGVVTTAQPLMVIVPSQNTLEVEAFIENKDIGFIKADQDVELKVETFQFTKYGVINGKVISVSSDAINDEKRGLIYSTRVLLHKSSILVDGRPVQLSPGMAVSVEIKTGQRRVIEYFLSPLIQYTSESLRER